MSLNEPQEAASSQGSARRGAKLIVLQAIGGILIVLGALAWWTILPVTLRSFEGFGVELGIVVAYILVFAVLWLAGTLFLMGARGKKSPLALIAAVIGLALLVGIAVEASIHGRPPHGP